jgi:hypothetical protein
MIVGVIAVIFDIIRIKPSYKIEYRKDPLETTVPKEKCPKILYSKTANLNNIKFKDIVVDNNVKKVIYIADIPISYFPFKVVS